MTDKLSEEYLNKIGFLPLQESPFEDMNLRYYVKEGFCLFSNEQKYNDWLLTGYAEMRNGKYHLVTFKWVNSIKELKPYLDLLTQSHD